jgi:uncharacterized protein YbjT (DUF2867 family)
MQRRLRWIILRPSVVIGRGASGGSALIRGLAALPVLPQGEDQGPLQVILLEDVVRTVRFFLRTDEHARRALDLAGPEHLSFTEVVQRFRRWHGWKPARIVLAIFWLMIAKPVL